MPASLARVLTAVSTTLADLGITDADVADWAYEPPDVGHPAAVVEMDLTDGRTARIAKGADGIPHVTWSTPTPDGTSATTPEPPVTAEPLAAGVPGLVDAQRAAWQAALQTNGVPADQLDGALILAGRIASAMDADSWDVVERVQGFGDITRGLATIAATVAWQEFTRLHAEVRRERDLATGVPESGHPCTHQWIFHASQQPLVPAVPVCALCQAIDFDHIRAVIEDFCKTARCVAEAERDDAQRLLALRDDELADVRVDLHKALSDGITVNQQRGEARTEAERLRGLLREALNEWMSAHTAAVGFSHLREPDRIAEIRREAGLQ